MRYYMTKQGLLVDGPLYRMIQYMTRTNVILAAVIGELYFLLLWAVMYNVDAIRAGVEALGLPLYALAVAFPVAAVAGMLVAHVARAYIASSVQIMKFALVGVLNTLLDIGIFNLLMLFVSAVSAPVYALIKAISFTFAVLNSYVWNKYWVFGAPPRPAEVGRAGQPGKKGVAKEFGTFIAISVGGLVINVAVFAGTFALLTYLTAGLPDSISANIGALTASAASFTWNFVGYKFVVFK
jgi:putative flippase GtrA